MTTVHPATPGGPSTGVLSRIKELLAAPVFPGDEEKTRTAAIMNVLFLTALASQMLTPFFWLFGSVNHAIFVPLWVLESVGGIALLRHGYVRAASIIGLTTAIILINVTVIETEGVASPVFSSHLIIAGCAGLVLGWRAMVVAVSTSILSGLVIMVLQSRGIIHPAQHKDPLLVDWLSYAVIFIIATILLGLMVRNLNYAFIKTRLELAERVKAERAMQESETRYRTLFEALPVAITVVDCDTGRYVDANATAEKLFGMKLGELMNAGPMELSPPKQPDGRLSKDAGAKYLAAAINGETPAFEWTHRTLAGREMQCEIRLVRLPSQTQRLVEASLLDMTERKRLEAHILHAQKMESVGLLAGGVAHDFNNLLAVIISSVELLDMKLTDPALKAQTADVRRAAARASQLTRQLLAFSRKQILQPTVLNMNGILTELEKMLRRLIGAHIDVQLDLAQDAYFIKADRGQLEQVILNLAVNARDAMPKGGTLKIVTRNVDPGPGPAAAGAPPGSYLLLEVADSGCGMDAATRARLFEPFFTTKEVGQGTGLGLSTAHGIVKQSGGYITVESEVGKGSTFRIYLPRTDSRSSDRMPVPEPAQSARGSETILIAEDNMLALNVAAQSLEAFGYRVLRAESPLMALQFAKSYSGTIHLLLTDVIMPRMNGRQLADEVRTHRANIGLLFMSGYTRDVMMTRGVLEEGLELIEKPFTPELLARRVRGVLDAMAQKS